MAQSMQGKAQQQMPRVLWFLFLSPPLDVAEVWGTSSLAGESPEPELPCKV